MIRSNIVEESIFKCIGTQRGDDRPASDDDHDSEFTSSRFVNTQLLQMKKSNVFTRVVPESMVVIATTFPSPGNL